MDRLNIVGFETFVDKLVSDRFKCVWLDTKSDRYLVGLVSSYTAKSYDIRIDRETRGFGGYQLWMYDKRVDISYPMTVYIRHLSSISNFIEFLDLIVRSADAEEFSGSGKGNETIK